MPRIDPDNDNGITLTTICAGPKYEVRVEALQPEYRVKTECVICGVIGLVDSVTLRMRFEPQERMRYVEKKFKCDDCGNRNCCSWDIVKVSFDE